MNKLFVDTLHLAALINPRDQWHSKSVEVEIATSSIDLVTTEDVLIELLNFYAEHGEFKRRKVTPSHPFLCNCRFFLTMNFLQTPHRHMFLRHFRANCLDQSLGPGHCGDA